jgi:MFS family permease
MELPQLVASKASTEVPSRVAPPPASATSHAPAPPPAPPSPSLGRRHFAHASRYALFAGCPHVHTAHRMEAGRYEEMQVFEQAVYEQQTERDGRKNDAEQQPIQALPCDDLAPPPQPPSYRLLRAFLMLCVAFSATATTCLGPFFPLYMDEKFNASTTLTGVCFSVLAFSQFLVCPFVVPLSRRITRLGTLKAGLVVSIAGGLLFGLVDRVPFFIVGRLLSGVGDAFIDVSSLSFLIQYSPNIRKDIGLLEGSSSLGYLLGPLLGGVLFFELGFRPLFLIMTAPYIGLLLVLLFVPSLFPPPQDRRRAATIAADANEQQQQQQHQQQQQQQQSSSLALGLANGNGTKSESKEGMEGGEDASEGYTALDASSSSSASTTLTEDSSTALTPSLTARETLVRLWRAVCSMPCLLIYISIITLISGALGWLDTALSEHLGK